MPQEIYKWDWVRGSLRLREGERVQGISTTDGEGDNSATAPGTNGTSTPSGNS